MQTKTITLGIRPSALDGSEWSVSLLSHLNPGVIAPCNL